MVVLEVAGEEEGVTAPSSRGQGVADIASKALLQNKPPSSMTLILISSLPMPS